MTFSISIPEDEIRKFVKNFMDNSRLNKVNNLIQQEMAEIFRKEALNISRGLLISVTEVRTTADLSISKIYLSVFPTDFREQVVNYVDENHNQFRKQLGDRIGKQMRVVPEIQFYMDETLDRAEEIDKALKGKGENPIL